MDELRAEYANNFDFREYVDRFCAHYDKTVDEALNSAIVKCIYQFLKKD